MERVRNRWHRHWLKCVYIYRNICVYIYIITKKKKKKSHRSIKQLSKDETSPSQVSRKTRFDALAYRINDWVDESVVVSKPFSSTPERKPKETSTPAKIRDPAILKSTSVKSVVSSYKFVS